MSNFYKRNKNKFSEIKAKLSRVHYWDAGEILLGYESTSYDVYVVKDGKLIDILDQVEFALYFRWED